MTDTPRLRSSFPQSPRTPRNFRRSEAQNGVSMGSSSSSSPLGGPVFKTPNRTSTPATPTPVLKSQLGTNTTSGNPPLIPFSIIDAPSQRLYVVAFYTALNAWRMYEFWTSSEELDSTWLFLKWLLIDGTFLFGLPALRIPWLEWAFSTTLAVFLLHAVANAFLMFRIPVCRDFSHTFSFLISFFSSFKKKRFTDLKLVTRGVVDGCFGQVGIR